MANKRLQPRRWGVQDSYPIYISIITQFLGIFRWALCCHCSVLTRDCSSRLLVRPGTQFQSVLLRCGLWFSHYNHNSFSVIFAQCIYNISVEVYMIKIIASNQAIFWSRPYAIAGLCASQWIVWTDMLRLDSDLLDNLTFGHQIVKYCIMQNKPSMKLFLWCLGMSVIEVCLV